MRAHWAYLKYLLRHKWYVFLECIKLGIPFRGLVHDWHKFLPDEWFPYVRYFYNPDGSARQHRDETGYYKPTDTGDKAFDIAWLRHQKRSWHHWQSWVLAEDEGDSRLLEMDRHSLLEMVADWRGAGRAQGTPDTWAWYKAHKDKLQLHPATRALVLLEFLFAGVSWADLVRY